MVGGGGCVAGTATGPTASPTRRIKTRSRLAAARAGTITAADTTTTTTTASATVHPRGVGMVTPTQYLSTMEPMSRGAIPVRANNNDNSKTRRGPNPSDARHSLMTGAQSLQAVTLPPSSNPRDHPMLVTTPANHSSNGLDLIQTTPHSDMRSGNPFLQASPMDGSSPGAAGGLLHQGPARQQQQSLPGRAFGQTRMTYQAPQRLTAKRSQGTKAGPTTPSSLLWTKDWTGTIASPQPALASPSNFDSNLFSQAEPRSSNTALQDPSITPQRSRALPPGQVPASTPNATSHSYSFPNHAMLTPALGAALSELRGMTQPAPPNFGRNPTDTVIPTSQASLGPEQQHRQQDGMQSEALALAEPRIMRPEFIGPACRLAQDLIASVLGYHQRSGGWRQCWKLLEGILAYEVGDGFPEGINLSGRCESRILNLAVIVGLISDAAEPGHVTRITKHPALAAIDLLVPGVYSGEGFSLRPEAFNLWWSLNIFAEKLKKPGTRNHPPHWMLDLSISTQRLTEVRNRIRDAAHMAEGLDVERLRQEIIARVADVIHLDNELRCRFSFNTNSHPFGEALLAEAKDYPYDPVIGDVGSDAGRAFPSKLPRLDPQETGEDVPWSTPEPLAIDPCGDPGLSESGGISTGATVGRQGQPARRSKRKARYNLSTQCNYSKGGRTYIRWTQEESEALRKGVELYGNSWVTMAESFPVLGVKYNQKTSSLRDRARIMKAKAIRENQPLGVWASVPLGPKDSVRTSGPGSPQPPNNRKKNRNGEKSKQARQRQAGE